MELPLRRKIALAATAILALFLTAMRAPETLADDPPADVRVMSFNIRYGTAKDGVNAWDDRKAFLAETITKFRPDLLGTQETLAFQRDYLAQQLSDYAVLGVGRDDGQERGEMMALYYRKDRFTRLDDGHFWLSESPVIAGSKSWDSSLPRMVTWVKLRDRRRESAPPIVFFNTHFDHRGPEARLRSAQLLREKVGTLGQGSAVIVTGDFNSGEGSPPYKALFGPEMDEPSPLVDCYRLAHPQRANNEGTATGFDPARTTGSRIDWIACSRQWQVQSAEIDRTARAGRTPSDHFPVQAILRYK